MTCRYCGKEVPLSKERDHSFGECLVITPKEARRIKEMADEKEGWCLALHGNHDEHVCHRKPGHPGRFYRQVKDNHECYCGLWW